MKKDKKLPQPSELKKLITKWSLNQRELADRIGMSHSQFKMNLSEKLPYNHFTSDEEVKIKLVFLDLIKDLKLFNSGKSFESVKDKYSTKK